LLSFPGHKALFSIGIASGSLRGGERPEGKKAKGSLLNLRLKFLGLMPKLSPLLTVDFVMRVHRTLEIYLEL